MLDEHVFFAKTVSDIVDIVFEPVKVKAIASDDLHCECHVYRTFINDLTDFEINMLILSGITVIDNRHVNIVKHSVAVIHHIEGDLTLLVFKENIDALIYCNEVIDNF